MEEPLRSLSLLCRAGRGPYERLRTLVLAVSVTLVSCLTICAASYNVITNKDFKWEISQTPHFDIYHYGQGGRNLLPYLSGYLAEAYQRSTRTLPIKKEDAKQRFPYLLYNSHNEFEQTNITTIGEGTGGVTEAVKNRLLVGNNGSQRYLQYVSAHEFTHEIEYVYLFSGFWRSAQLLRFVFYPNWLMEGMAEYNAGDLDYVTREMYMRDASLDRRLLPVDYLQSFSHVLPHQVTLAYKESECLMHFIADEYGEDKLPLIMSAYRSMVSPDAVLAATLGTNLPTLDAKFREYMHDAYAHVSKGLVEPIVYGRQLTFPGSFPRFDRNPAFSPDGNSLAYLSDSSGATELYLMDLRTRRTTRLWNMAKSVKLAYIHEEGTGLAFSPDGQTLAFIAESEQRDFLCLYRLSTKELRKVAIDDAETLASPAYSPDGETIYLSVMKDGFRDLFAWHAASGKAERLTEGAMDETDVCPSPDGRFLLFARERISPAGRIEYDLCRLDLESRETKFITDFSGDERYPCLSPDGKTVYFVSSKDGVEDIYRMGADGKDLQRLTKVIGGTATPRLSPDGGRLAFSSFRKTEMHLYLMDLEGRKAAGPDSFAVVFSTTVPIQPPEPKPVPQDKGPYRFHASTDLLYPFIAYSSLDGLYLMTYWQISEFMGNHTLATNLSYASGVDYLNYQVAYGFLRYRPKLYVSLAGDEYWRDFDMTVKRRENSQALIVFYPLNRFQELGMGVGTIYREEKYNNEPWFNEKTRENILMLSFLHDTTYGPYLETLSGYAFSLSSQLSGRAFGGTYSYQTVLGELFNFFPMPNDSTIATRLMLGGSYGADPDTLTLGGPSGVRGLPVDEDRYAGNRLLFASAEYRFPLVKDINYHLWWFFPDFFFKSLYGTVFMDTGRTWNDDRNYPLREGNWRASTGLGLRCQTFILESFSMLVSIEFARRLDAPDSAFYITPGYSITLTYPFIRGKAQGGGGSGKRPRASGRKERT